MSTARCSILAVVILMLTAIGTSVAEDATTHPDLSGNWTLNEKESQNLQSASQPPSGGSGGGGGGRGGGGRGGGGRGGGNGDGDDRTAERQERMEQMTNRMARLEIFHEDPDLDLTDGLDISRTLHTDGRQDTVWTEFGQMQASAAWQGDMLVITWHGEQGSRTTTLKLTDGGSQLTVYEQLRPAQGGGSGSVQLVYDRSPATNDSSSS